MLELTTRFVGLENTPPGTKLGDFVGEIVPNVLQTGVVYEKSENWGVNCTKLNETDFEISTPHSVLG